MSFSKKRGRTPINTIAFCEFINTLMQGEWSYTELCEQTGISYTTARNWIKFLRARKPFPLVYIAEHRRTNRTGACLVIFSWNHNFEHKDAIPPKRKSQAEYSANYRENKRRRVLSGFTAGSVSESRRVTCDGGLGNAGAD